VKKRVATIVLLLVVAFCLVLGGVALAANRTVTVNAYRTDGRGGTLNGQHYYASYSTYIWSTPYVRFAVTGNTRSANDVKVKVYSVSAVVWSYSSGSIVGGAGFYQVPCGSCLTQKGSTKSWWFLQADVNNATDPSNSAYSAVL
jgi:hypothetical protein